MKVANIIIAHKNPSQLARLINQYDGEMFHNFVHIDAKCDLRDFQKVFSNVNVSLLPKRKNVHWSGYGTVDVTMDAFRHIKSSGEKFFYFNFMSGMDFPIRPTHDFYHFLKTSYENNPREFFEILDLDEWPNGPHSPRYERYHLTHWTIRGRYFSERIINWFLPRRKFYRGKLVPYGRAAWFTATDHFVEYAIKFFEENPDYARFLKTCWTPDEFAFNTLIMNSEFKDKVSDYLRFIDWSEGKVNPKVFRQDDLNRLLASGCFIARKFDETIDSDIIDSLERVIGKRTVEQTIHGNQV